MTKSKAAALRRRAAEILRAAEELGAEESYYFVTTFARYQRQLKVLDDLERAMSEGEVTVTKEYIKGKPNVYASPTITQYMAVADAANRTVAVLLKIMAGTRAPEPPELDPVKAFIESRR